MKVANFLKDNKVELVSFVRFQTGEGIEKREENFAEEVMSQIKVNHNPFFIESIFFSDKR